MPKFIHIHLLSSLTSIPLLGETVSHNSVEHRFSVQIVSSLCLSSPLVKYSVYILLLEVVGASLLGGPNDPYILVVTPL